MDSSESPTYGEQEGGAYNGHFGCTCYHPLFVFNQLGDVERCALRSGNVHSADGWHAVLEPVIARYRGTVKRLFFSRRRGLRQSRDLRVHRSRGHWLHNPAAGQ
jgi:Transposase DDE domain group 1